MKSILFSLIFCTCVLGQTVAVSIEGTGINSLQTQAIENGLQASLKRLGYGVVERSLLEHIFQEQALQLSGGVDQAVEVGRIAGATQMLIGSAGRYEDEPGYFFSLRLIDVESGQVLGTVNKDVAGTMKDFIGATGFMVRSILKPDTTDNSVTVDPKRPVQIIRREFSTDVHVFHHAGTERAGFMPCGYCQGRGYIFDNGKKLDCPECSVTSSYCGPETHGRFLTGHWIK